MTNRVNCQNQAIPAYSGITINITNPMLNPPTMGHVCSPQCPIHNNGQQNLMVEQMSSQMANKYITPAPNGMSDPNQVMPNNTNQLPQSYVQGVENGMPMNAAEMTTPIEKKSAAPEGLPQAYPPQYYLNNYNYIQNGEKGNSQLDKNSVQPYDSQGTQYAQKPAPIEHLPEEDMSSSKEIIEDLDAKVAEQKELEKNGKQTKVVALTNEYIMSLENYLNNENSEIRLMASKEILTRLDEDKTRHDDAALNALLNKMLQDPEKLVRIAALSAFSSQLASGNDYTIKLLTDIQNNPNSDKEDVLQAADGLLKMSSRTEVKYTPVQNNNAVPTQVEQ